MRDQIQEWMNTYPRSPVRDDGTFSAASALRKLVTKDVPAAISVAVPASSRTLIRGSIGKGDWTHTPWVALLDPAVTTSVEEGLYVVYLLSHGCDRLYLTIAQGCTDLKDSVGGPRAKTELRRRAEHLKSHIADHGARLGPLAIDLASRSWRGRLYEASVVVGTEYRANALPLEADLIADLTEALALYGLLAPIAVWQTESEILREAWEERGSITLEEAKRYRQHRSIERKPGHSKAVKKAQGPICKGCETNLTDLYGQVAKGVIEAHHLRPLSALAEGESAKYDVYEDFAVLCPNCHRVIHRMPNVADVAGLKALVKAGQTN